MRRNMNIDWSGMTEWFEQVGQPPIHDLVQQTLTTIEPSGLHVAFFTFPHTLSPLRRPHPLAPRHRSRHRCPAPGRNAPQRYRGRPLAQPRGARDLWSDSCLGQVLRICRPTHSLYQTHFPRVPLPTKRPAKARSSRLPLHPYRAKFRGMAI